MIIRPGEFAPDQADFQNMGSPNVVNVLPLTSKDYGPLPSLAPYSGPLALPCQGAVAYQDASGNNYVFAGDAHSLYMLQSGSPTFTNISKSGGYNTPANGFWRFCQYGLYIIATNFADNVQVFTMGTSTLFADLSSSAPRGAQAAIIRNFLVLGNTYDTANGAKPQRIWWSGLGDPTDWPAPDTNAAYAAESDLQDLFGDYGHVTGIVGDLGTSDGAIFCQRAVIRINYVGSPDIFTILPAENVRGTSAPASIVQLGALVYYRADDGFYAFDGTTSMPIGFEKIDNFFLKMADPAYVNQIVGGADPISKVIYWSFATQGSNGLNNATLIYHPVLQRWSYAAFGAQYFLRALSFGYALDQLDQFGTLDTLPASLDSPVWTGGRLQLAAFDASNRMGYFSGPNLAATVDTSEDQLFAGKRARVTNAKPLTDGGTPTVSIGSRDRLVDAVNWGPTIPIDEIGNAFQRSDGRYHRARIQQPAGSIWQHLIGVDVDAKPSGVR